jgi:hypothetical protein
LDAEDLGDDELDDEELEAQAELDKDREASDDAEIQDLAEEVERDAQFFVGAADSALGRSALLKVCFMKCLTWLCQLKSQSAIRRSRNLPSGSFTTLSCEMTWRHVVHEPNLNRD